MPLQLNDKNETVRRWRQAMAVQYRGYARVLGPLPTDTDVFGLRAVSWQQEYERRTFQVPDGIVSDQDLIALGVTTRALPLFFTVEGHQSDMFYGPVADTATQLEREGVCHHLPTWYNNGAIPFDNQSGVNELARRVGQTTQDNGVPSPAGTPLMLGGFSQGMIVLYDFCEQFLMPGQPLAWRMPDIVGFLQYGNPCRATDISGTHGLDPYKRFGLPGCVPEFPNVKEVWRHGDIFAENTQDQAGDVKAAVYEAIARGDLFSNPISLTFQIMQTLSAPFTMVMPIVQAIISGIVFLTDQPSPHYSPYDITDGLNWSRTKLTQAPDATDPSVPHAPM